ncbi:MAG: zinc-ribbon domain-containing protein [Alphaproteobacteria bacterium]|nr:zinc-ribbon domain-containing protein [Alphaproteobacteria bacterium]
MKVVCPQCSTEFDVPSNELWGGGRRVRCSHCSTVWLQEPVEEDVFDIAMPPAQDDDMGQDTPARFGGFRSFNESLDIEPIPASVHPDSDDDDEDGGPKGPGFFATLNYPYLGKMVGGFAAGVLLVVAVLMGGAKAGVMPKMFAPFYSAFGAMPHAGGPLAIKDVKIVGTADGGTYVSGWLANNGEAELPVPALEVTPIDAGGEGLEGVRVKPEEETIKPGEGIEFKAQLQAAPPEGGTINIDFVK